MLNKILNLQWQRIIRWWHSNPAIREWDDKLIEDISECYSSQAQLHILVDYFWRAHKYYLDPHKTRAYYPGFASMHGRAVDGLEGVSRTLPLWAAYASYEQSRGASSKVAAQMTMHLKGAFLNGTNSSHSGYWGDALDNEQIICEAADIALSLWLSRSFVFNEYSKLEQVQITDWLKSFLNKQVTDNNWHLFIALIDSVITNLDATHSFQSGAHLQRIHSFYISNGAYSDGPSGNLDFYNAWCFHYALFWIHKIHPSAVTWDYPKQLQEFTSWYQYLITQNGFTAYGRSICYRFAVASPLLACAMRNEGIQKEIALNANFHLWRYFVKEAGVSKGRPNQGLFHDDESVLDNYNGPASSFWGVRSLVMLASLLQENKEIPKVSNSLPSDKPVVLDLPKISINIQCIPKNKEVILHRRSFNETVIDNSYYQPLWKNKLREWLYAISFRGKPTTFVNLEKCSSHLQSYKAANIKSLGTKQGNT
ncbi:DUF2264 domain-containing protein [Glaciecola sp. 2405UD65-10]|uniref:DUF2264 domain-containing protein n=1 Tax=Glaciecola sp. 2405UD65-10 TaxID=3397244 RepID=UPI003B5950DC